jgi:hypothetical protein
VVTCRLGALLPVLKPLAIATIIHLREVHLLLAEVLALSARLVIRAETLVGTVLLTRSELREWTKQRDDDGPDSRSFVTYNPNFHLSGLSSAR